MALLRQISRIPASAARCQGMLAAHQQSRGYADTMSFTLASPGDVYYKEAADIKQVDVPTISSAVGILPKHVPTLGVLKPGLVKVYEQDGSKSYFVSSGTLTVNDDSSVQILAEEAHPLDRFDRSSIAEAEREFEKELSNAQDDKSKMEAQIALDALNALSVAVGH